MLSSVFNPNNDFWQWLSRVTDIIGLSLCWLLCSLPLFTLGAATAALYDAVAHGVHRRESGVYVRFFRSFAGCFKTATGLTLLGLLLIFLFYPLWQVCYLTAVGGNKLAGVLLVAYLFLLVFLLLFWLMSMLVLSRFTMGWKGVLGASAKLLLTHLPSALLLLVLTFALMLFTNFMIWTLFFTPGLWLWLLYYPVERLFRPFLGDLPEET